MEQSLTPDAQVSISLEVPNSKQETPVIYLTINSDTPSISKIGKPETNFGKCYGQLSQEKYEPKINEDMQWETPNLKKMIRKKRIKYNQETICRLQSMIDRYNLEKTNGFIPSKTLKQIAAQCKVSYSNVLVKFRQFKEQRHLSRPFPLFKRTYKEKQIIMAQLKHVLNLRSFQSQKQLMAYVNQRFGTKYTRKVFIKYIKKIKQESAMKERPLSEYPTDRCIATIMNDLLHKDYFLLYYSYHCIHCQNGEKIALSVLCSKKGMLFIVNDLFEKNHVSSSFNFILKSYRECYGLAQKWFLICQGFEKDNLRLRKNDIKNKKIEKEVLEQKGHIFYIPNQFWSYNLAEREIRYVVSANNSTRTKEKMFISLIMAKLRFPMTVQKALESISTELKAYGA